MQMERGKKKVISIRLVRLVSKQTIACLICNGTAWWGNTIVTRTRVVPAYRGPSICKPRGARLLDLLTVVCQLLVDTLLLFPLTFHHADTY